jgi:hypothetical protein
MKKNILLLAAYLLLLSHFHAQPAPVTNAQRAKALHTAIYKYLYNSRTQLFIQTNIPAKNHNAHADLWGLCAMIQAANELEALDPTQSYMTPVVAAIDQYYDPAPPAPGFASYVMKERQEDRYYDDNQWIGIAYMDAYRRNKIPSYLDGGHMIYTFMMTGYDTISGGGLYWKEKDLTTKNTCSNGPGILLALQLYEVTQQKNYLDTALLLYNWVNQHLQAQNGVYWDAIKPQDHNRIDAATYTYNTGTMLEANVHLYGITADKRYLREAQRIAAGSYDHFIKPGKLGTAYWFNAVLLRGYEALYKVDKNRKYLDAMQEYANQVWEKERDENNLVGRKPEKELLAQAGMLEIYARLARLELK